MRFPFITAPMMLEKSEKKPPYELKQAILAKSSSLFKGKRLTLKGSARAFPKHDF
jgi:hypothetical protein